MKLHRCSVCKFEVYQEMGNPAPERCPCCWTSYLGEPAATAAKVEVARQTAEGSSDSLSPGDRHLPPQNSSPEQHTPHPHHDHDAGYRAANVDTPAPGSVETEIDYLKRKGLYEVNLETAVIFEESRAAALAGFPLSDTSTPGQPPFVKAYGSGDLVEGTYRIYFSQGDVLFIHYANSDASEATKSERPSLSAIRGVIGGIVHRKSKEDVEEKRKLLDAASEEILREICKKEVEGSFMIPARKFKSAELSPPSFWARSFGGARTCVAVLTLTHQSNEKLVFYLPTKNEAMTLKGLLPDVFDTRAKLNIAWHNLRG